MVSNTGKKTDTETCLYVGERKPPCHADKSRRKEQAAKSTLSSAVPLANRAILPDCGVTGTYVALIKGSTRFHLDVLKFFVTKELLL